MSATAKIAPRDFVGVPESIVKAYPACGDGRCCALVSTLRGSRANRKHKRCKKTVPAGQLFCSLTHATDASRTCGTVWQHKITCTSCYGPSTGAQPPAVQPPPNDMADWAYSDTENYVKPAPVVKVPAPSSAGKPANPSIHVAAAPRPVAASAHPHATISALPPHPGTAVVVRPMAYPSPPTASPPPRPRVHSIVPQPSPGATAPRGPAPTLVGGANPRPVNNAGAIGSRPLSHPGTPLVARPQIAQGALPHASVARPYPARPVASTSVVQTTVPTSAAWAPSLDASRIAMTLSVPVKQQHAVIAGQPRPTTAPVAQAQQGVKGPLPLSTLPARPQAILSAHHAAVPNSIRPLPVPSLPAPTAAAPRPLPPLPPLGDPRGYNVVLHTKYTREYIEQESKCIAPSGIKLRIRLARACQPANWCVEQRPFISCLETIAGVHMQDPEPDESHHLTPSLPWGNPDDFFADVAPSFTGRGRGFSMDSTNAPHEIDTITDAEAPMHHTPSPAATTPWLAGDVHTYSGHKRPKNVLSSTGSKDSTSTSISLDDHLATSPEVQVVDLGLEQALLEEVLASSLTMDLQSAPVGGDSWLTSVLIDFIALQFARKYPNVHFLPTNFMAYELRRANASNMSFAYVPKDLLNREVHVHADAIPPVVCPFDEPAWTSTARQKALDTFVTSMPPPSSIAAASAPSVLHAAPPQWLMSAPLNSTTAATPRSALTASVSIDQINAAAVVSPTPISAPLPITRASPYTTARPAGYTIPTYSSDNKPLVFFWNIGNMHWNLVRVNTGTHKDIEVYEPMGKLASRAKVTYKSEGLSLRSVPRDLIDWLDCVCPLATADGWKARTVPAITSKHQGNGFDCGVACLLYAEKCAQGFQKEDIMATTDQEQITRYRKLLSAYLSKQGSTTT